MPLTAEMLGARLQGHTFLYALNFTFYLTRISPNETAAICRGAKLLTRENGTSAVLPQFLNFPYYNRYARN